MKMMGIFESFIFNNLASNLLEKKDHVGHVMEVNVQVLKSKLLGMLW